MQKFKIQKVVGKNDLDELKHVNNVIYVQWIQEVSSAHWSSVATPDMMQTYLWVVRNHNISYLRQAVLGDQITIETHIIAHKGPLSIRAVEMKNNKTGETLVTSETHWCLLASGTFKPLRVPDDIKTLF